METKRGQTDDFIPGDETRQKRRRLARGELQEVKNMPYDIACEICRHLHPKDILLLARRKPFRTTLMNESAKSIWIASRQSYGIPDPIPSMSEPAHANLLFDGTCHFCVDGKAQSILWSALLRCCKECLVVKFSSAEELCQAGVDLSNIEDLVPYHYLDRKSKIPKWHGVRWIYLTSAAKALFDEYEKSEREGPVALSAFMDRKKSERQAALAQIRVCSSWQEQWNAEKKATKQDIRKERADAIIRKLEAKGWEEELQHEDSRNKLLAHKRVREPRLLTEKIWGNIGTELDSVIAQIKFDRLKQEELDVKKGRFAYLEQRLLVYEETLTRGLFMPSAVDIAQWEPFKVMIDSAVDAPQEDNINRMLRAAWFLEAVKRWNKARYRTAFDALRKYRPDAKPSDLLVCTTLFTTDCGLGFVYGFAGILSHKCRCNDVTNWYQGNPTWNCRIEAHDPAIRLTKRVCEIYGLDPLTTSFNDLLALNPLIGCQTCSEPGIQHFTRWVTLSAQDHSDHLLFPVSSDVTNIITLKELDKYQAIRRWKESLRHYRCKLCHYRQNLNTVLGHLRTVHNVASDHENQMWVFEPSEPLHCLGQAGTVKWDELNKRVSKLVRY